MQAPPRRAAAVVAEQLTRDELERTVVEDSESDAEDYVDDAATSRQASVAKPLESSGFAQRTLRAAEESWQQLPNPADLRSRTDIMSRLNFAARTAPKKRAKIADPMLASFLAAAPVHPPSAGGARAAAAAAAAREALMATGSTQVQSQVKFGGQMVSISRKLQTKQGVCSWHRPALPRLMHASAAALAEQEEQEQMSGLDKMVAGIVGRKGISTVEKSSADWDTYKQEHKLEDELADAPRAGFVEKESFLLRVDGRQFESERAERERARVLRDASGGGNARRE
jgi:hypothetical protein